MRIYNTQESPRFRQCIRTTEKHNHSVDDDLFDLGLGCQMGGKVELNSGLLTSRSHGVLFTNIDSKFFLIL